MIRLALSAVAPNKETNEFVPLQAYRANEMSWLSVGQFVAQAVYKIILRRFKQFVTRFFFFKLVMPLQFLTERFQVLAKLKVHYVGTGEFIGQRAQKLNRFAGIFGVATANQVFDLFRQSHGVACRARRSGHQTKRRTNRSKIQVYISLLFDLLSFPDGAGILRTSMERCG